LSRPLFPRRIVYRDSQITNGRGATEEDRQNNDRYLQNAVLLNKSIKDYCKEKRSGYSEQSFNAVSAAFGDIPKTSKAYRATAMAEVYYDFYEPAIGHLEIGLELASDALEQLEIRFLISENSVKVHFLVHNWRKLDKLTVKPTAKSMRPSPC